VDNLTALTGTQGPVPAVTAAMPAPPTNVTTRPPAVPTFAPKPAAPIQQASHAAPAATQPTGAYEARGLVYSESKPAAPIQQASHAAPAATQPTGGLVSRDAESSERSATAGRNAPLRRLRVAANRC